MFRIVQQLFPNCGTWDAFNGVRIHSFYTLYPTIIIDPIVFVPDQGVSQGGNLGPLLFLLLIDDLLVINYSKYFRTLMTLKSIVGEGYG